MGAGTDITTWAVMPAAGMGTRMASACPKQYLPLAGRTVIEHALQPLLQEPRIRAVVVALSAADAHWPSLPVARDPRVMTTPGGRERADSVLQGLRALKAGEQDWVLVHDAARPCLAPAELALLLDTLCDDPVGGLLAVPVADTLKREREGRVAATVDRVGLWRAQTPQMFRYGLLRQALESAQAAGVVITDEAAAMERAGHAPRLVPGCESNIKLTRAEDHWLAEHILAGREPQG